MGEHGNKGAEWDLEEQKRSHKWLDTTKLESQYKVKGIKEVIKGGVFKSNIDSIVIYFL